LELHVLDPRILVRGRRRRGQNRELTRVLHQLAQQLDLAPTDRRGVRLVDEELAAVDIRVERDDLRALRLRLIERWTHGLRVVTGDDDACRMRLDRGLDRRLLSRSGVLRARRDDLLVTELREGDLTAPVGDDLVRVERVLR